MDTRKTMVKTAKVNASNMVLKGVSDYPNLKNFLAISVRNLNIETENVSKKFEYPQGIIVNKLHSNYGIFMDYFIRKVLSNKYKTKINDDVTELVLKNFETYFKGRGKDRILHDKIQKHYEIFKDPNTQAMDILESIKCVSLAYTMSFHDPLPRAEVETNNESLLAVKNYFDGLPYKAVEMKASTDCEYFSGNADLIFDQNILYEIKTSKYSKLSSRDATFSVNNFNKLILYGFGFYKKTGKLIKCFKIYNPLLGLAFTLVLNDIDMKHFEEVLEKDVENYVKPTIK